MTGSAAKDWLAHMILGVKTIAAGAEFIPVPYIRAACGTVVILLETVDVGWSMFSPILDSQCHRK
jgi:hypothetical protein